METWKFIKNKKKTDRKENDEARYKTRIKSCCYSC